MHGHGELIESDGRKYVGDYQDGQMHGHGISIVLVFGNHAFIFYLIRFV
jgi:hypothetical protein